MRQWGSFWRALALTSATFLGAATPIKAELTELAFYRLGDDDGAVVAGNSISTSVERLEGRDLSSMGDVFYSDDTPAGIGSALSASFDGDLDNYLFTDAVAWHNFYPGFRVGMEAWIKVDPEMEGLDVVPFGNGSGYYLSIDAEGYPLAHAGPSTVQGISPITYGEWQHVAFWTTGSFWQVYLNGEPQLAPLGEFSYGSPGGLATVGADRDGARNFKGNVDELRVFTWTGPFNPGDLLFYSQRAAGDVNEDGIVDQNDYDVWRANVGADLSGTSLLDGRGLGDLNTDGIINLDDFALIKANLSPGQVLVVPEPSSLGLLLSTLALPFLRRRRRRAA